MHRTWVELARHYQDAAQYAQGEPSIYRAMEHLCRSIGQSHIASGLFGHTSHHTLRIAQIATTYPPHPSIQWLTIEPFNNGQAQFRFEDTYRVSEQWRRNEMPTGLLDRFNGFLNQVGWSYEPIEPAQS